MSRTLFVIAALVSSAAALIGASTAAADTSFSETSPFTYAGTNMCTGEAFSGTGNLHMEVHDNLSTSGALEHHLLSQIDGLKAVAMVTGKKYVVQDTYFDEFVFSGADEETFHIVAHYIRVGEDGSFVLGDDFYEYFKTHITTNDLGVVTAYSVEASDQPCQ